MMIGTGDIQKCFLRASRNTLKLTFSSEQSIKNIQYLLLEYLSASMLFSNHHQRDTKRLSKYVENFNVFSGIVNNKYCYLLPLRQRHAREPDNSFSHRLKTETLKINITARKSQ